MAKTALSITVAANLRRLMKARRLTGYALAAAMKCDQSTIHRALDGKHVLESKTIVALARYFEVSTDRLLLPSAAGQNKDVPHARAHAQTQPGNSDRKRHRRPGRQGRTRASQAGNPGA